jgi:hypothetical protein
MSSMIQVMDSPAEHLFRFKPRSTPGTLAVDEAIREEMLVTIALTLPRRRTLFDEINITVIAKDDYVLELMEELNELNEEAAGFRWAAGSETTRYF